MSYLAYPNFFEEGTQINHFTETLDGEMSAIHSAIFNERICVVAEQMEDSTVDVNIRNKNFETPLLAALRIDNRAASLEIAKRILHRNPDINLQDYQGDSPLHELVRTNQTDDVHEELLHLILDQRDCNVDIRNHLGETPLHLVTLVQIAKTLVQYGADVDSRDNSENTPLHVHVTRPEICELLLESGASVDSRNLKRYTPLHEAVSRNMEETVTLLLRHGADPDVEGDGMLTPLQMAYHFRTSEDMKELLWLRTDPLQLMMTACYDHSLVAKVIETWKSVVKTKCEIAEFLNRQMTVLQNVSHLKRIVLGKVVSRYFLEVCRTVDGERNAEFIQKFRRCLGRSPTNFVVKTLDYTDRERSEHEVFEVVSTFLNHGDTVDYSDMEIIYLQLGDCSVLHMLLKVPMCNRLRKLEDLPFFPKALCNVTKNLTDIINNQLISSIEILNFFDVHNLARYCTLPKKLARSMSNTFDNIVRFQGFTLDIEAVERDLKLIRERSGVPKLLELSRNSVRPALCRAFHVTKSDGLYSVLVQLQLPPIIVSLIMMDIPIYHDINVPTYFPTGRHLYLL